MLKKQRHRHNRKYGTTLLCNNKPGNIKLWGDLCRDDGHIDVEPTVCAGPDHDICPHYHHTSDSDHGSATQTPIHLLIASYRDRLCPRTLHNAFTKAENPHRVFIRVIEQTQSGSNLVDDASCWERYCTDYRKDPNGCSDMASQVRTIRVDAAKASGPTGARSKLSAMILWDYEHRDEEEALDFHAVQLDDFCMETDSHMDFSTHWDTEMVLMHHRTKNDYAVLSTYVAAIDQNDQDIREVPNLCMVQFTSTIRNWGTKLCRNLKVPKLTNMWGAGLSFHRCHAEINVPVDPFLDNVFDGEEGSRGFRFFTHGYDVYTPDRVLVTHDYRGHQSNPVVHSWGGKRSVAHGKWKWMEDIDRGRSDIKTLGTARVNMMLGIGRTKYTPEQEKEITAMRASRYGLGTKRTLEQAMEFSGIDLREKKMVENKCGNLFWVPYEESQRGDYGVGEFLTRGVTGQGSASHRVEKAKTKAAAVSPAKLPEKTMEVGKPETAAPKQTRNMAVRPMKADTIRGGRLSSVRTSERNSIALGEVIVVAVVFGVVMLATRRKRKEHKKS